MNWNVFGRCCSEISRKTESQVVGGPLPVAASEPVSPERKKRLSFSEKVGDNAVAKASSGGTSPAAGPALSPASKIGTPQNASQHVVKASSLDKNAQVSADDDTMSVCSSAKSTVRSGCSTSSLTSEYIKGRIPERQREAERIQKEMKKFVRTMVRGTQMGVLSPDGQMRTCTCSLDKKMKHFVLELKKASRKIALSSITEVYQGKEPEDIDTPLDDLCSTLTLDHGDAITFHFKDVPSRENFAMCLQLLVDGSH